MLNGINYTPRVSNAYTCNQNQNKKSPAFGAKITLTSNGNDVYFNNIWKMIEKYLAPEAGVDDLIPKPSQDNCFKKMSLESKNDSGLKSAFEAIPEDIRELLTIEYIA